MSRGSEYIYGDRRADAMRTKWAPYLTCTNCKALAGLPCKQVDQFSRRVVLRETPCTDRPTKD